MSFTSCASHKSLVKNCKTQTQKIDVANINGSYEGKALWKILYKNKTSKKDTTVLSENCYTKINFDGEKHLTVSVFDNDVKKNEIVLNAKIEGDFLSIKARHQLVPLIVYFKSDIYKIVLYNDVQNNLGFCGYKDTSMYILFFSGGDDQYFSGNFNKINEL